MTDVLRPRPDPSTLRAIAEGGDPDTGDTPDDVAAALRAWKESLVRHADLERQIQALESQPAEPVGRPGNGASSPPGPLAEADSSRPPAEALDLTPLDEARRMLGEGPQAPDASPYRLWKQPFVRLFAWLALRFAVVMNAYQQALNERFLTLFQRLGEALDGVVAAEQDHQARFRAELRETAASMARQLELGKLKLRSHAAENDKQLAWQRLAVAELRRESADLARRAAALEEAIAQDRPVANPDLLDELRLDFEDRFRGTRGEIKQGLTAFLPIVRHNGLATRDRPALDLGCGRGEWLELLRENGLASRGLESNRTAVRICRAAGLDVAAGDELEYLRRLPDASLGLVTAFHFLGRLAFPQVSDLLTEIWRVLQPEGMVVFENPNPENLDVGAGAFGIDRGHLYAPSRLSFLLERSGFTDLELESARPGQPGAELELLDAQEPQAGKLNPVIELLNARFALPADYTVIARKPARLVSG